MDEMKDLRDGRPDPVERSLSAARNRLTEETAMGGRRRFAVRLPVPSRGVARAATGGALSIVLAGGLIASQTVDFGSDPANRAGGGGAPAGDGPAAVANADVLLDRAAAAMPGFQSAEPDDFGYVESKTVYFEGAPFVGNGESVRRHLKQWLSVSGSRPGLLRGKVTSAEKAMLIPDVKADPGMPKATAKWQDQRLAAEDDKQDPWQPSLIRPNYAYLKSLPNDPDALLAKVRETCASRKYGCTLGEFGVISHVLVDTVVPPEVRSGLLKAAKRIEGIALIENATLAATGERGVAVAYTNRKGEGGGYRYELVFDPKTYEILGTQQVKVETSTPPSPHVSAPGKDTERREAADVNDQDGAGSANDPDGAGGGVPRSPHPASPEAQGGQTQLSEGERATVDTNGSGAPVTREDDPVEPGTVTRSTAIIAKGIVDKVGQQP